MFNCLTDFGHYMMVLFSIVLVHQWVYSMLHWFPLDSDSSGLNFFIHQFIGYHVFSRNEYQKRLLRGI